MYKTIDREKVLDLCDGEAVITSLGIRTGQRIGRRLQIICPAHNDNHLGNCFYFTDEKRFYCHACHALGNIIDIVMYANHWTEPSQAYDAMRYICDVCGIDTDKISDSAGSMNYVPPMLTQEEQDLIGVYNKTIYDENEGMKTPEDRVPIVSNPLGLLRIESPETYCDLVIDKCNEKIEKTKNLLETILKSDTAFIEKSFMIKGSQSLCDDIIRLRDKFKSCKKRIKK